MLASPRRDCMGRMLRGHSRTGTRDCKNDEEWLILRQKKKQKRATKISRRFTLLSSPAIIFCGRLGHGASISKYGGCRILME